MEIWIVKHTGKPGSLNPAGDCDVLLFASAGAAHAHITQKILPLGFKPYGPEPKAGEPWVWALLRLFETDEFVSLEGPKGIEGEPAPLSDEDKAWLKVLLIGRIDWIDDYSETRREALEDAGTLDRIMAHHGLVWPELQTATEWATAQVWPDEPPIEQHPAVPIEQHAVPAEPLIDEGGPIDDEDYDSGDRSLEYPEGSGG